MAASMSTMLPERMPSAGWWPMPTTRSPCPSTRATKQTTLLVPMSSAAMTPFLVFATMSPVSTRTLAGFIRCHAGPGVASPGSALPEIELVRQPQIDDAELARQQPVLRRRAWRACWRAATASSSGSQISTPLFRIRFQRRWPTQTAARSWLRKRRLVGEQQQQVADMLGRAGPAQQQQRLGARRHAARPHGAAVRVDQRVFGAVLPDRDGAAFPQRDVERVRQAALDGGARSTQSIASSRWRDACRSMPSSESPRLDVEGRQDRAALDIVAALDRDVGQLERRDGADDGCATTASSRFCASTSQPSRHAHQPPPPPQPSSRTTSAEQHRLPPQRTAGLARRARASCAGRSRGAAQRRPLAVAVFLARRS